MLLGACHQLNDERIPAFAVNIDLSNAGVWNAYGVPAWGDYNYFVLPLLLPQGFNYTAMSQTGYGGVLLVCGQNPFTGDVEPLAYDMACPVERQQDIRVWMVPGSGEAECQECHSRYDVLTRGGAPTSNPALALEYALTPHSCVPSGTGYIIL